MLGKWWLLLWKVVHREELLGYVIHSVIGYAVRDVSPDDLELQGTLSVSQKVLRRTATPTKALVPNVWVHTSNALTAEV